MWTDLVSLIGQLLHLIQAHQPPLQQQLQQNLKLREQHKQQQPRPQQQKQTVQMNVVPTPSAR